MVIDFGVFFTKKFKTFFTIFLIHHIYSNVIQNYIKKNWEKIWPFEHAKNNNCNYWNLENSALKCT